MNNKMDWWKIIFKFLAGKKIKIPVSPISLTIMTPYPTTKTSINNSNIIPTQT